MYVVHVAKIACLSVLLCATVSGLIAAPQVLGQSSEVPSIAVDTSIDPASAEWLKEALNRARDQGAKLAIIRLDTPGGLDTSMRDMVKRIIAAPMPVVVYVSPDGARAASAGLFITEAADVAAMAPQTNIGSASPITIGPGGQNRVLGRKIRNDAAAYVRALAQAHGRNPNLAEQMVRKATNVTAAVAKRRGLIDLVADSEQQLLRELDGFKIHGPKARTLSTDGLTVKDRKRPFKFRALELLVDPNVAFILLLIGLAGLGFEIFNPGAIAPGAFGAVALILALFGIAQLPVNVAGILLIVLALALLVAEAHIVSHGVLGLSGTIALAAGGLLLFNQDGGGFGVSAPLVIFIAALFAGFILFVVGKAVQARHKEVHTGWEELVGEIGEVRVELNPVGQIFAHGALWRARSADDTEIGVGARVVVDKVEGLTLIVRRA